MTSIDFRGAWLPGSCVDGPALSPVRSVPLLPVCGLTTWPVCAKIEVDVTYQTRVGRLVFSEYFQKVEQKGKYILVQPKYWGCKKPLHDLKISIKVLRTQFENLSRAILYQSRNGSKTHYEICVWPGWSSLPASDYYNLHLFDLRGRGKGTCAFVKEIRSSMQALWVRIFIINI